jgi:hypothetical protein
MLPVWNLSPNGSYISDLAISDDGSRVITGSVSGMATVYDQNGTVVWSTQEPGSLLVGIQGNGSVFILGSQENSDSNKGAVRAYDANGSQVWKTTTGYVGVLGLSGTNNRVVIGDWMGDLLVLNNTGQEVARFNDFPKTKIVAALSVSDTGNAFAYVLSERYPQIRYVTVDTKKKRVFRGLFNYSVPELGGEYPITHLVLSGNGNYVGIASGEGSKGILSLYTSTGALRWSKDIGAIRAIAITPNGSSVFAGTENGTLLSYTPSGNLSWTYPFGAPVTRLSLSKESDLLSVGTEKGDLFLFNEAGTQLWTYHIEEFPVGEISRVELSRNGTALIVLVNRKNLYYFIKEPEPLVTIPATPVQERLIHENGIVPPPSVSFQQRIIQSVLYFLKPLQSVFPVQNQSYPATTSSSFWLDGWHSRKTHTIIGSPGGTLTNYQMKFVIHRTNGSDQGEEVYLGENGCLPDYADLRFFTNTTNTSLPYWIESSDASSAVIWVKVPVIPSNSTDIRMYYGNADALGETDGDATFLFFDHFDQESIERGKWRVSGTPVISHSILELNTTKGNTLIVSRAEWPVNTAFTSHGMMNQNTYQGYFGDSGDYLLFWPSNATMRATNNDIRTQTTALRGGYEGWARFEIIRNASSTATYLVNDTIVATHSTSAALSSEPINIVLKGTANSRLITDYVFVRSYIFPEPVHANWSAQETPPPEFSPLF